MKRYLLFAGPGYYPQGGIFDYCGDFETAEDAKNTLLKGKAVKILIGQNFVEWSKETWQCDESWFHIYDTDNNEIIEEVLINRSDIPEQV